MKKTLALSALILLAGAYSHAQNTFPATGNVGIGTTAPGGALSFIDVNQITQPVGITWYNPGPTRFGIHRTAGSWTGPDYQQLRLGWETGIVLDPGTAYGKSYVDIGGNGLRVSSGNVGIGTTSPAVKLHVVGGHIAASDDNNLSAFVQLWSNNAIIWKNGTASNGLRLGCATDLSATGWSEKMRITDAGSLGIGTTSPAVKLHVVGGHIAASDDNNLSAFVQLWSNNAIIWKNGTAGNGLRLGCATDLSATGWSEKMRITDAGDVGIGTTDTKGYRLAVNGNAIFTSVKVKQYAAWPDYVFDADYALPSLADVETYIKTHKHLPDVISADEAKKEGIDLGSNQGQLLKKVEELTLYMIEMNKKVECLQHENATLKADMVNIQSNNR